MTILDLVYVIILTKFSTQACPQNSAETHGFT